MSAPTTLQLLKLTEGYFREKGLPSPRVDAELLLAHTLGLKRLDLYLRHDQPLAEAEVTRFRDFVRRRAQGQPVQHITGEQAFYSLTLQVSDKVLVPRPETEGLVEAILKRVAPEGDEEPRRALDVGTGSGAIALMLASAWPRAAVTALDLSPEALRVARDNARLHVLDGRVRFLEGDLLAPLAADERFDLIVSNPPYIPTAQIAALPVDVRDHEPHLALDGGPDGLDVIRRLAAQAPAHLVPHGWLFLEIGDGQAEAVRALLRTHGFAHDEALHDLAGKERVVFGRLA